mmetsp:Transcript_10683/g.26187  ORF Transcript_10683/g.26187 Transcript_10683/m.26187 type:complete len:287 (-) Transcript_10683:372-1232(-)
MHSLLARLVVLRERAGRHLPPDARHAVVVGALKLHGELVDVCDALGRERDLHSSDVLLELLHSRRSNDDAVRVLTRARPREGHLRGREPMFLGKLRVGLTRFEGARRVVTRLELRVLLVARSSKVGTVEISVLPGEGAARQRAIHEQPDAILASVHVDGRASLSGAVLLELPFKHAEVVLDADGGGDAELLGRVQVLHDTNGVLVTDAPVLDLARLEQFAHRLHNVLNRNSICLLLAPLVSHRPKHGGVPVGPVDLVQIKVRRLKPLERRIACLEDLITGQARLPL